MQLENYGVVAVVDDELLIRHVSGTSETLLGVAPGELVGEPLAHLVDDADVAALRAALERGPDAVGWRPVTVRAESFKLHAFDAGHGLVGIDLLPLPGEPAGTEAQAIERVARWNERLQTAESVGELVDIATQVTKEATGFDGSWTCRIEAPDRTSTVISADVPAGTPSALGSRVQPSDLPPDQPRLRGRYIPYFVADLSAPSTELVPAGGDADLTGSQLLLPFPDWLGWLASVGPRATTGIPITYGGELWGWILAHHPSPMRVPVAVQSELRMLGFATGARLAELIALDEAQERLELSRASVRVLQTVASQPGDVPQGLAHAGASLLGVCEAESVVVAIGGAQEVVGRSLSRAAAAGVVATARADLRAPGADSVVSRTTLGDEAIDVEQAAGFAATRLDPDSDHLVVWVRGERRRSLTFAAHEVVGDVPQDELFRGLGERQEIEEGASAPWTPAQLRAIAELREALAEVFVARYGEVQSRNVELERSNEEYDAFAHAAAHDLKAPLRGIRQSIEFFVEDTQGQLAPDDAALLDTAVRLVARMTDMLDDLMTYARSGRDGWSPERLDVEEAVADAVLLLGPRLEGATVVADPGQVTTDRGALRQLLLNLLGNAEKYAGDAPARVTIRVATLADVAPSAPPPASLVDAPPGTEVLVVADRGIGIDPAFHERVFALFHQLDPGAQGTGTGLALCRLICRRHGGDIWLTSTPGEGTTFYVVAGALGDEDRR